MTHKPDLAERIGTTINELDIDFSRLTVAGWLVSGLSLACGGGCAYFTSSLLVKHNGLDLAAGMVFFITMMFVTTISFLALRWLCQRAGFPATRSTSSATDAADANLNALQQLADAGVDLSLTYTIDFSHRFQHRRDAAGMARQAGQMGFQVGGIATDHPAHGYDVQVQVDLVPTLAAINDTESVLAAVARQHAGQADGWCLRT